MMRDKKRQRRIQEALDSLVIKWIARVARDSCPRGDMEAVTSAFCSEVVCAEYAIYFPYLEVSA